MSSRHLIDPQLLPLLEQFPTLDLSDESLPARRQRLADFLSPPPTPAGVHVREIRIPGSDGAHEVRVVTYAPATPGVSRPAILQIHGGGYVMGSPEIDQAKNQALVEALGCIVVSPDYRLAPETPFPGPVEDCYAALRWLYADAEEMGVDKARIAIAGASAGGGLAASLALLARDRGEIPVCFQLLIYPMLDDRTTIRSEPHPFTGEFVWTRQANYFGWKSYLGKDPGGDDVSPYAAAGRATSLTGLPPTYLEVGALDLFLEENIDYARRLIRAGIPTEMHIYSGAYHGFQLADKSDVAQVSATATLNALERALGV